MKKITVFGGGSVGSSLAKILSDDGNDITVIDTEESVLDDLQEKIDIKTLCGNAAYPAIQKLAGVKDCDMIIAVTASDEVNMVACQIAKQVFNVPRTVARLRPNEYLTAEEGFKKDLFSIDEVISPSVLLTEYLQNIMTHPGCFQFFQFSGGLVQVVAVKVLADGPLAGKKLSDFRIHLPKVDVRVGIIFKDDKPIYPTGDTVVEVDDEVYFIATEENMRFMSELRKVEGQAHNVMIAGGGNVGSVLAKNLESNYSVKLIEKDKTKSKKVAEKLTSTVVLNDDISDENFLKDEGINDVDYFCAVTNDDQMNILSSKLSRDLGAKKTIAIINKSSYRSLVSKELDIVVSPADVTISSLLASVRTSDIVKVNSLGKSGAEVIEVIAHGDKKTSKLVGKKISELALPETINIGAVVRNNKVILANEDIQIEEEDHVIIFTLNKKDIAIIEKLFQVEVGFF
ncbi:MAG: Trk system potassium transporter TrkA [Pseudomonadota bacterium]|nr:Trk system potassium transporter TrkA [Pseudomonadota bacterium]MEC8996788.1 Trk system potassium transporter TrkA [Pseudomonadota bacterium]MED5275025.1 Trk system potassium transporter TrkA [Pseudomonadota bacterium]MED5430653.1 Trk system potassium transporter TrkA [Pseudomonadota bacterium]|tara:strand:+ start:19396 stop:20766 length:1371 start_codon:yes stop_codon:yes gene_type:complete